ncbi:MAG TPA: histidine kinase N-terminal 7TM domain-containing protein [Anaerolineae bacterium]|nr:histidine kinase N-terminal 7TM domain-containing protein [Anaerolineae bacterium]
MAGSYAYTPEIWPSLLSVVLLVALAVYSWRRRAVPGARALAASCLIAVPWVAGAVMEVAAVDVPTKLFWFKFQATWQLPAVTAVTCFVLEYAWPGRWLTCRNLALLSIPSLLLLGLILTNDLHHLVWRGFTIDGTVIPLRGPANWASFAYAYGLGILHLVVLAWLFVRSPQHRWPVAFMFAGGIVGRVLYFLEAARVLPAGLPFNVPPIAFEYGMYAIALFGFRIFDPIAAARQVVIAQMREGVLVLDLEGRVASLNPAAQRILRLPVKEAMGQPVRELLPAYLEGPLADPAGAGIELSLPGGGQVDGQAGQEVQQYVLEISPLTDWRGLEIGRLLLLRDVTERRQAQAQLLEQQRALAMLREREHLARELHDSIGQVLGFASLKTGAARKLIADGKLANADDQLSHLESIMADAHADVREYILNLRTAPTAERPFFMALQHYLAGYRQNYGFQVDLSIGAGVDDGRLPPEAQMQLFRILQEALSNVRKHAETNSVQVSFVREGGMLRLCIQDNGQGFEPQQAAAAEAAQTPGGHLGLRFMRERAEQMGGTLRLDSAPRQGTCVTVDLPLEGRS